MPPPITSDEIVEFAEAALSEDDFQPCTAILEAMQELSLGETIAPIFLQATDAMDPEHALALIFCMGMDLGFKMADRRRDITDLDRMAR